MRRLALPLHSLLMSALLSACAAQTWSGGIKQRPPMPLVSSAGSSLVDIVKESAYRSWVLANAHHAVKDKVFFLGPAKPAPNLVPYFDARGFGTCKSACLGKQWHRIAKKKQRRSPVWTMYDAFLEPAGYVDFEFLDRQFPTARFVLKTSKLRMWANMRMTRVGKARMSAGCPFIAEGPQDRCSAGNPGMDNSAQALRGWILNAARAQNEAIEYFNRTANRRQRFAALELPGTSEAAVRKLLDWVTRQNPERVRRTADVVLSPSMVPNNRHNRTARPSRPPLSLGHGGRPLPSDAIDGILLRIGCGPTFWGDVWYNRCARQITMHA